MYRAHMPRHKRVKTIDIHSGTRENDEVIALANKLGSLRDEAVVPMIRDILRATLPLRIAKAGRDVKPKPAAGT